MEDLQKKYDTLVKNYNILLAENEEWRKFKQKKRNLTYKLILLLAGSKPCHYLPPKRQPSPSMRLEGSWKLSRR